MTIQKSAKILKIQKSSLVPKSKSDVDEVTTCVSGTLIHGVLHIFQTTF